MNQIFQWSFRHPYLAALVAYIVLWLMYIMLSNILQIAENMLMRFQCWMIAGRLRDKDGNITRENIESFGRLVDKIEENDKQKKDKEDEC